MMQWIKQFDFFLFDFDGLLVNTEELHLAAYREVCQKRGFDLQWTLPQFFGAAHFDSEGIKMALYREFPDLFAQEPNWEVLYQEKKAAYQRLLQEGKLSLMPGVQEVLKELESAEKKRCVVTHSAASQVELIKSKLPELNSIPHWFPRETYDRPKPFPDGYLKAVEKLGSSQDRSAGFEDSLRGLRALQAAGIQSCFLICPPDHPQLKQPVSAPVFSSFNEL